MSNLPAIFKFEKNEIRVVTDEIGETWFVVPDIAEALGYVSLDSKGIAHIPDEWKGSYTEMKQFKSLTRIGMEYGRNETSPQNPRETQPLYFVDKFPRLIDRLNCVAATH